jgi:hypothetical protein
VSDYKIVNMWRVGHSDGYTHTHNGPLYSTEDAAEMAGREQHGNYAVAPKSYPCITMSDGRTYIVEGPVATADEVELEKQVRKKLLAKLTPAEQRILGIKP